MKSFRDQKTQRYDTKILSESEFPVQCILSSFIFPHRLCSYPRPRFVLLGIVRPGWKEFVCLDEKEGRPVRKFVRIANAWEKCVELRANSNGEQAKGYDFWMRSELRRIQREQRQRPESSDGYYDFFLFVRDKCRHRPSSTIPISSLQGNVFVSASNFLFQSVHNGIRTLISIPPEQDMNSMSPAWCWMIRYSEQKMHEWIRISFPTRIVMN